MLAGLFACTENDPLSVDPEIQYKRDRTLRIATLSSSDLLLQSDYPMSVAFQVDYHKKQKEYMNDGATLKNGSIISLPYAALTPPEGYRIGEPVTITFNADTLNGEMIYSFGPSGCQFDPPLKVVMNYKDLIGNGDAKLFYIAENGEYIEQQPNEADLFNKWMTIYVHHFSRYAVAYGR